MVIAPAIESPCAGTYQANAQLSVPQKLVVIDRFHDGGERETIRLTFGEIEQVEYELVQLDSKAEDGAAELCSVIYLRDKKGLRVSFDDDTRLNLEKRALRMGQAMGKKTVTTRRDLKADPRPLQGD
jgi:hypothetical protein